MLYSTFKLYVQRGNALFLQPQPHFIVSDGPGIKAILLLIITHRSVMVQMSDSNTFQIKGKSRFSLSLSKMSIELCSIENVLFKTMYYMVYSNDLLWKNEQFFKNQCNNVSCNVFLHLENIRKPIMIFV